MQDYTYTAFISYRHTHPDQEIAKKLHTYIENYSIPREIRRSSGRTKMGRVFRDQDELPLSSDLGGDIRAALDRSEWLIAVCSPRYPESRWCMAELDYFISLGRRDHILVIMVEGEPEDAFPDQLRYTVQTGETVEIEPLAGDVRAETLSASLKKLRNEKLRLLAPMLGVNYDQLRQRARRRKMRIIGAAAAASFALLAGFLSYALIKNGQVSRQRDIAVENERQMLVQRDRAMNNQMQLLIEESNASVSGGNKLTAIDNLRSAVGLRDTVGRGNDVALRSALEYALYNDRFETVQTIKNDHRRFESMVFSHNDRYLLAVSNQNSANLIDTATGEILFTVARSEVGQLDSVGFTADDRYFYMVDSWFGYVSLYDVTSGELTAEYNDGSETAWTIGGDVFPTADGKLIINESQALLLWDYRQDTCEKIYTIESNIGLSNRGALKYLTQSPDGKRIAFGSSGYGDGMMILSLDDMSETALERDRQRGYMNMRFNADGRYLSAVSGAVSCVWDISTGRMIYSSDQYDAVAVTGDGQGLIASAQGSLAALELRGGKTLWEIKGDAETPISFSLSPDGKYICAQGGISGIYDVNTGTKLSDSVGVAFSHDGTVMLVNPAQGTPSLLITPEYASVKTVDSYQGEFFTTPRYTEPKGMISISLSHTPSDFYTTGPDSAARKTYVYISPDLQYAAHTAVDGFIEIFDISDPDNARSLACIGEHCYFAVTDGVFSGSVFASCGGYDQRCVLFDVAQRKILHVLPGTEYMHACEFSKDGSKIILLCGKKKNVALVYTTASGNLLYRFDAPEGKSFEQIGFNEQGTEVAAVTSDGAAVVGELYPTLDDLMKAVKDR